MGRVLLPRGSPLSKCLIAALGSSAYLSLSAPLEGLGFVTEMLIVPEFVGSCCRFVLSYFCRGAVHTPKKPTQGNQNDEKTPKPSIQAVQ